MSSQPALVAALSVAVPLLIAEYRAGPGGGPSGRDRARVSATAGLISGSSDGMLFRGDKPGHAMKVFNAVADALAVLAFCPGGVSFAGEHWAAGPANEPKACEPTGATP